MNMALAAGDPRAHAKISNAPGPTFRRVPESIAVLIVEQQKAQRLLSQCGRIWASLELYMAL